MSQIRQPADRSRRRDGDALVRALAGEDEATFLLRRVAEERAQAADTSCIVRSVHEEMVETYEERLSRAAAETDALEALAALIKDA